AAVAGHRQQTGPTVLPTLPNGSQTGDLPADVAVDIRVEDVLRGHLPALRGAQELRPAPRPVEREAGEIARRARFAAHPAQGVGAVADRILVQHRAVDGEFELGLDRRAALDRDALALDPHRHPAAVPAHLVRV